MDPKVIKEALESEEGKAAIKAAVDEAVAGLKAKNAELLSKLDKAKSDSEKLAQYEKLRDDYEALKEKHEAMVKEAKEMRKQSEALQAKLAQEQKAIESMLIDGGLTEALTKANVIPALMPAAKALLSRDAKIVVDGDKRLARIKEKDVAEFVKEWVQSDEGKHFVSAPQNAGGGSTTKPGTGNGAAGPTARPKLADYAGREVDYYVDLVRWEQQQQAKQPA